MARFFFIGNKISPGYIFALLICSVFLMDSLRVKFVSAQTTCLDISDNLWYGKSDQGVDNSIINLQTYLKSLGYMNATPNGYFGPATFAAVKLYQVADDIPSTGYVGPMTRASLKNRSCGMVSVPIISSSSNPISAQNTNTDQPVSVSSFPVVVGITSPTTGQALSIGSTIAIKWANQPAGNFDISLEQPGGAGAGFVVSNLSSIASGNQYVWKVGTVFSSSADSNITVQPGTYRLRLQSSVHGASANDQVSGWFTITAMQFKVSTVIPSSGYADNASSVVLSGTGFASNASVYFDSDYSNLRANNQYISPDGSVLVFTVPSSVSAGLHTLYINDGKGSSPITLPLTINSPQ
ncbi:MAG: peptidoglycan-binding protein [Patescibacteria group bacterium]|nr:peptidoglycan-binding protein [Patescibacteria group bacterium]